jgi:hypothetical protein
MAKKKLLNAGRSTHRFKDNPEEKRFAAAWDDINKAPTSPGTRTLDYLISDDGVIAKVPSKVERELAATVVQWLGSECGQFFLSELGYHRDVLCGLRRQRRNTLILEMTEKEALEMDLIVCKCGHRKNNHFEFSYEHRSSCAHCACKGYTPVPRVGTLHQRKYRQT